MNRTLSVTAVFLAGFTAALWLFFPYSILIDNIIRTAEKNMHMDIGYRSTHSGVFSTDYIGVRLNSTDIGDVSISHSPLKLFTGRVGVTVKGIYATEAVLSKSTAVFDMETTGKALSFIKEPASLEGTVRIKGTIDQATGKSDISGEFEKMIMPTPLGQMVFTDVSADVTSENGVITVHSLTSAGKNELNLTGTVRLRKKPSDSDVDLKGSIRFMGRKQRLTLRGNAGNLHPILD